MIAARLGVSAALVALLGGIADRAEARRITGAQIKNHTITSTVGRP